MAIAIVMQAGWSPSQPHKWENTEEHYVAELGKGAVGEARLWRLLREALMHDKWVKASAKFGGGLEQGNPCLMVLQGTQVPDQTTPNGLGSTPGQSGKWWSNERRPIL